MPPPTHGNDTAVLSSQVGNNLHASGNKEIGQAACLSKYASMGKSLISTQELRNRCLGDFNVISRGNYTDMNPRMRARAKPLSAQLQNNGKIGRWLGSLDVFHAVMAESPIAQLCTPLLQEYVNIWSEVLIRAKQFCLKLHKPIKLHNALMSLEKKRSAAEDETESEFIEITVDPGACDWVASKWVAMAFNVTPTDASRAGVWYRSACGTKIYNDGGKTIRGHASGGSFVDVTWQIADVTKPFGSV